MPNGYRITVERLPAPQDGKTERCTFDVTNHDELLALVERVRTRGVVPEREAAEFTIGLKLFGEVLLRHRHEPLFADFLPYFGAFMKRLKKGDLRDSDQMQNRTT